MPVTCAVVTHPAGMLWGVGLVWWQMLRPCCGSVAMNAYYSTSCGNANITSGRAECNSIALSAQIVADAAVLNY
jgi:hypothetical protein